MKRIICVGSPTLDTILRVPAIPAVGTKVLADACVQVSGGMSIAAGATVVRLGGRAEIWARLGDDGTGRQILADLAEAGLVTAGIRILPGGRSTVSTVLVDHAGERLVVPFYDPALDQSPDWLPLDDLVGADMLMTDPRWPDGAAAALAAARDRGVRTMLDADLSPPGILERLVPLASHAVFSEPGINAFAGSGDPEAALRVAAGRTGGFVAMTAGPRGLYWMEEGRLAHEPAPEVPVVDTLSAGDVFHGAFALAIAEGAPIRAAARFANGAASMKCRQFGGRTGTPTRPELESFLGAPLHRIATAATRVDAGSGTAYI